MSGFPVAQVVERFAQIRSGAGQNRPVAATPGETLGASSMSIGDWAIAWFVRLSMLPRAPSGSRAETFPTDTKLTHDQFPDVLAGAVARNKQG